MQTKRLKVKLQCKRCGEIFTLRGKKDKSGQIETGLKRCICDNEDEFHIVLNDL